MINIINNNDNNKHNNINTDSNKLIYNNKRIMTMITMMKMLLKIKIIKNVLKSGEA